MIVDAPTFITVFDNLEMDEQPLAHFNEREIAKLINDQEANAVQLISDLTGFAASMFSIKLVHKTHDTEEADVEGAHHILGTCKLTDSLAIVHWPLRIARRALSWAMRVTAFRGRRATKARRSRQGREETS